jgi:hypothetical protein
VIRAGTTRGFAFQPQFGCGLSRPRTLGVAVVLLDGSGSPQQSTISVPMI